uniref:Putative periplasmic lipoprotein n=1 Tax=Siphoviridae sp. ctnsL8 TaxID=2825666 RepID=A0A8S5PQ09_9CAUD|nr:MAG TPA: putative periplasmic lipoprotein [Siphoviridae sp. ctnsL8]
MKKLFTWLKESNRYKHLLGGIAIGAFANSLYCAAYAGIGVATALELKDKMWGGKFDLVDLSLTLAGVAIGYGVRIMII